MSNTVRSIARAAQKRPEQGQPSITLPLGELVDSYGALTRLAQHSLPAKTAFQLSKIVRAALPDVETYETTRKALCERYGTLPKDKTQYQFSPDNQVIIDKEAAELRGTQVTLLVARIKLDALASLSLPALDLISLNWLIEE